MPRLVKDRRELLSSYVATLWLGCSSTEEEESMKLHNGIVVFDLEATARVDTPEHGMAIHPAGPGKCCHHFRDSTTDHQSLESWSAGETAHHRGHQGVRALIPKAECSIGYREQEPVEGERHAVTVRGGSRRASNSRL